MLQSKLKNLEADVKNLNSALEECSGKFNEELVKRNDDMEFYKKSYEEQKNRVNKEHELISSSLYELALQFMSLKNELQKRVNPSASNLSISRTEKDINNGNK